MAEPAEIASAVLVVWAVATDSAAAKVSAATLELAVVASVVRVPEEPVADVSGAEPAGEFVAAVLRVAVVSRKMVLATVFPDPVQPVANSTHSSVYHLIVDCTV